jgi:hypothetical protein
MMGVKNWVLIFTLLAGSSFARTCTSGDCQQGTIAGPYTAAQDAEFTSTGAFPVCHSSSCTEGSWSGDQTEGMDAKQNIGGEYQFYDANYFNIDANIAVGATVSGKNAQVLEWINGQYVQAFDKVTGQPIFTSKGGTTAVPRSVAGLWSSSTQAECQNSTGNVQVIYDRLDNEFVISRRVGYSSGRAVRYAWCIAASSGSDLSNASTQWFAYEYKMDTVIPCIPNSDNCTKGPNYYYFPDWPRIGTWSNGFYITFDLEDPTVNYTEAGFEACRLDRGDITRGKASNPMSCYAYTIPLAQRPSLIHSVDVADVDSTKAPASGETEYFLSIVNPSNAQQGGDGRNWCTSQTRPCTSNQLALFKWGPKGLVGPNFIAVNSYTPGCYDTSKAKDEVNTFCVPEPSTNPNDIGGYGKRTCGDYDTPCVDSLGDRMANRLTYNNLSSSSGPNGEFLTASHVVMESASNQRTGIRYYILKVSNGVASALVNSGGASGPPDLQDPNGALSYFMPSAALDQNGNLGIAFTASGTQNHPAISFDVLPWMASSFDPPTLIVQGTGDEEDTDRWGEYAATVIDSTDNLSFYGMGEYYNTSQTGTINCSQPSSDCHTWQTRLFRGKYGAPF